MFAYSRVLKRQRAHTRAAGPRGWSRHHFIQGAMICRALLMGMAKQILWPWAEIMELMPNNRVCFK